MKKEFAIIPVIIPSLEPDDRFLKLLSDLSLQKIGPIVVVDDGSGEKYRHFFHKAESEFAAIVLTHDMNYGKGRALKDAFSYCLDKWPDMLGCITADSDGQHTPKAIVQCKDKLIENPSKLILGSRNFKVDAQKDIPLKSRFGNQLTCKVFQSLYRINISDTQTGLRGIPSKFMKYLINVPGERFEFETQMLIETTKEKIQIIEVPIETIYDSKENHSTHFNPILDSVRIYKLFGFEFGKFVISSLSSSVIDLLLFSTFCKFLRGEFQGVSYVAVATICARLISAVYNYLINYLIVFKSHRKHASSAARYAMLAAAQMLCSAILTTMLYKLLPVHLELAVKLPVDCALFFISYVIQKRIVY